MVRIALTKNLFLDEYLPKGVYLKYAARPWILRGLVDERLVRGDQLLRDRFGRVMINNWWTWAPGCGFVLRQWSGLRTCLSPDFAPESQHTFCRASDKLFRDATAEEVRAWIRVHFLEVGITCIEEGVSWVHSDVRWVAPGTGLMLC